MRVARALKQDVAAVAAAPFAETAWTHLQLVELDELDALARDAEELRLASRVALAIHEPKALQQERAELERRLRAPRDAPVHEARARGLALARRLQQGQVLTA